MKFASAAIIGLATSALGVQAKSHIGACPSLKETLHDRGEKLEPQRLSGLWKVIYNQEDFANGMDCFTVNMKKDVAGLNETQLQVLDGYMDLVDEQFVYDDDVYFTFNHPEQSNMAAIQDKERLNDPGNLRQLAELEEDIKPMPQEIIDTMKEEDRISFEESRQNLINMQNQMKQRILESSPYDSYYLILDTDYDNYLMKYRCYEMQEKVNTNGQSREDIALLKLENGTKEYDEEYVENETRHSIYAAIQTRSLDKSYLTQDKIESLVTQLKGMINVGEEHFETFKVIEHGENCPNEQIDMFEELGSRRFVDVQYERYKKQMESMPKEDRPDFMKNDLMSMMSMIEGMGKNAEGADMNDEDFSDFDMSQLEEMMAGMEHEEMMAGMEHEEL